MTQIATYTLAFYKKKAKKSLADSGVLSIRRTVSALTTGPFRSLGTDTSEVTVTSRTVIEHFNVIEDISPSQIPDFIYPLSDIFSFLAG